MSLPQHNYINILESLKQKIRQARTRAAFSVNTELLKLYWEIGNIILAQQKEEGWGAKIINRLEVDLKTEFPDFKGLSVRNLKYMRAFAEAYPQFGILQASPAQSQNAGLKPGPLMQQLAALIKSTDLQDVTIVQQAAAQLPWGHHQVLLDKIKEPQQRLFYIFKCIENGWSRNILSEQIASNLFERQGKAITNFKDTLPPLQSDLAQQTLKNPYVFDFLSLNEEIKERELEKALIQHLKRFMLELGKGYAYVGNQKNIVVGGDDYFLDLLFYNYHLHCFVVFELKIGAFKPEYAGKLNFYVNTINEQLKGAEDKGTIGILLCKTPNETVVKYALQGIESPIGVADYELARALPKQLKGEIPTVEELEAEIDKEYEELKSPSQKRFDTLKGKLAQLKGVEIKQTATIPILFEIIDKSLLPVYQAIIKRIDDFKDWFVSCDYYWQGKAGSITDMNQLAIQWKNEDLLKSNSDLYFSYRLSGFKKAGTEAFGSGFQLNFRIDPYWYGFALVNYNNQEPFIKKLYHEQLSKEDIAFIIDIIFEFVMTDIERRIEYIKGGNK